MSECHVLENETKAFGNHLVLHKSLQDFFSYAHSALQTDSPEEMHGWIRDIEMKIQDFRGPCKVNPTPSTPFYSRFLLRRQKNLLDVINPDDVSVSLSSQGFAFKRASSLYGSHNSASRRQQSDERRPTLLKSCSVTPGWQPWMPVPSCEPSILDVDDEDSPFNPMPTLPSPSSSSTSSSTSSSSNSLSNQAPCPGVPVVASGSGLGILAASGDAACGRRRHRSQPQPHSGCSFPFGLDDDSIRTTDV